MENNLYYPPTIEEFYVGFEYEIKIKDNWRKKSTTISDFSPISDYDGMSILEEDLISNIIRVKTLDQSDIESLGWVNSEKLEFTKDTWILRKFEDGLIIYKDYSNGKFKYPWLYEDSTDKIFEGTIKNKSQLKFIMKCLGILE